jgi:hypothetical protein
MAHIHGHSPPRDRHEIWRLIEKLDGGLDALDAKGRPLSAILEGPFFREHVPGGWDKKPFAEGRLRVCARTCGDEALDAIYSEQPSPAGDSSPRRPIPSTRVTAFVDGILDLRDRARAEAALRSASVRAAPAARYVAAPDVGLVAAYFNPGRYRSRLRNFQLFAAPLLESGAHFVVVECALPGQDFELGDFFRPIRTRSSSVLWHKERLLNLAIAHLPPRCTKVVWLDGDVLFENANWMPETSARLDRFAVMQPFSRAVRLPLGRIMDTGEATAWEGFAEVMGRIPEAVSSGDFAVHGHTGFAWGMRREILQRHGLYDACIAGGADHLMAHAFTGEWESACLDRMLGPPAPYRAHAIGWCERIYEDVRARVGHVPGQLLHLWHGELPMRRYWQRLADLARAGFDPLRDVKTNADGCLEWASEHAALHDLMRRYFAERREDD